MMVIFYNLANGIWRLDLALANIFWGNSLGNQIASRKLVRENVLFDNQNMLMNNKSY